MSAHKTRFGQVVVGPPGSGKTTYCRAMQQFLQAQGRKVIIVNLDPANDVLPFQPEVDSSEFVSAADVMETECLGPNGALIYCMQFLELNFDLLMKRLDEYEDHYVLFDFPGQVELYTHDDSVPKILKRLEMRDYRLVAVNLVDAHHCSDAGKFISILLTCLTTMLHLALPHVNVLSKLDQAERHDRLQFGLEFYTEVLDLERLVQRLDDHPRLRRYRGLSAALAGLVERYGLVSFTPLAVEDRKLLAALAAQLERVGGGVCAGGARRSAAGVQELLACAVGAEFQHERIGHAADTYLDGSSGPLEAPSEALEGPGRDAAL